MEMNWSYCENCGIKFDNDQTTDTFCEPCLNDPHLNDPAYTPEEREKMTVQSQADQAWSDFERNAPAYTETQEEQIREPLTFTLPPHIVIVVEGGIVQTVLSDTPGILYTLIDYDADGVREESLIEVPEEGGGSSPAFVAHIEAHYRLESVTALAALPDSDSVAL